MITTTQSPTSKSLNFLLPNDRIQQITSKMSNDLNKTRISIGEAIQSLVKDGLIVDTGMKRWSAITKTYQTVWALAERADATNAPEMT